MFQLSFSVCRTIKNSMKSVTFVDSFRVWSSISHRDDVIALKGNVNLPPNELDYDPDDYKALNPLEKCDKDLSDLAPYFPETFNIAAYVNKSETLQTLVQLGVNLSKIEKKPYITKKLLQLDFVRDMKPHIFFLKDYVPEDDIGIFLTKNPMIFTQSIDDMQTRINYLQSKKFTFANIQRIVSKNPHWLMFSTLRIDQRLGFFQQKFKLNGNEVRLVTVKQPRLITYNLHHIKVNTFAIKEECGFTDEEIKELLLCKPKLWMMDQLSFIRRFNYIHNTMKIPHEQILKFPECLLCRVFKIKERHTFLEKLGRAQYDPKKENYVSLKALVEGSDSDFCNSVAKCTTDDFDLYLKTV